MTTASTITTAATRAGRLAARRNVYVRQEDLPLWEKAQRYARLDDGASLSTIIARSLGQYVAEREAVELGMERIQLEVKGVRKAFVGRWLVSPQEMNRQGEEGNIVVGIATTRRGQFAAFWVHLTRADIGGLEVFASIETMDQVLRNEYDMVDADFIALVRSRLDSGFVQELDI
jgi:hypothetical protein